MEAKGPQGVGLNAFEALRACNGTRLRSGSPAVLLDPVVRAMRIGVCMMSRNTTGDNRESASASGWFRTHRLLLDGTHAPVEASECSWTRATEIVAFFRLS